MGRFLSVIFGIAGLVLGIYFIWPDVVYFLKTGTAALPVVAAGGQHDAGRSTFLRSLETGEHALLYAALILLPAMYFLHKFLAHKLYSALVVLVFSVLCVLFAHILHASIIDGYVFFISQRRQWASIARPAAVFVIVAGNWLIAFAEMYRVVKVAGK